MNRLLKSAIYVLSILLVLGKLDAQNLPEYHFKMLQGDTLDFYLFSYTYLEEVAPFVNTGTMIYPSPTNGGFPADNIHLITYDLREEPDFTGEVVFNFEYRCPPGTGYSSWDLRFSRIYIEVGPSILEVENDHVVTDINSGTVDIDVLANDSSTHEPLYIESVTNEKGGTALINGDNTLSFTPESGFEGVAYFNYLVKDAAGSTELGQVSIQLIDEENQPETVETWLATLNTRPLSILLPGNDYQLDDSPDHGTIEFSAPNRIQFIPEIDIQEQDTFVLSNGDFERSYIVEIYDNPSDGLAVVDDVVYTMEDEGVMFNVNVNDNKEHYLLAWTQPDHGYVNYLNNGEFTYIPDEAFRGYDEFSYTKRVAPFVFQTATVRIGVGNFEPVALEEYPLNTLKNQAIVVNYAIPVDNFSFEILSDPDFGTLTFYEGYDTITIGCNEISGYNLVVYEPEAGFTGTDEFELDYCPADADCTLVKVRVNVLDEVLDPDCPCIGEDCVWKGDTNQDGVVDVRDLLPIGYYMGEEGNERTFDSQEWIGLNAANWNSSQENTGANLKHVDSDGNGLVEANDTLAIRQNYDKLHTILPKGVNASKPFPVYLSTDQDSVNAGDWLHLTIAIGDADNPVMDLNGFTYTFQFPPELIDSNSLMHYFYEDSWFANASSTLQMDMQPVEGRLDAGFTRIGPFGASGHGPVASCDFIVEDDIDDFKLDSQVVPLIFKISGGTAMDQNGHIYDVPETEKIIYLDLRKKTEPPVVEDLIVYPNPASDYVNIHLNGQDTFQRIDVYTATGILVNRYPLQGTNSTRLSIQGLQAGVYIIVAETTKGKTAQRFEVIK